MSRIFQLKDKLPEIAGFYPLDVGSDETTVNSLLNLVKKTNLKVDIMVHAIGFAPRECFDRHILFVDDDSINTAITISANSLQRIMRHAMPYLNNKSSTITLTYAASTRFVPNYGVMSIAKAALESWTRELACHQGQMGID